MSVQVDRGTEIFVVVVEDVQYIDQDHQDEFFALMD